jgi:hypothetical protein
MYQTAPLFYYGGIAFGVAAGLFQLYAYWLYARKISRGRIKPNTASWSIWAFSAVLESVNYIAVTQDWVKSLLPTACALSAILLFIYCLHRGHFKPLSRFDWSIVILDNIAILVWWFYQSAEYANLLLILSGVVSFVPIIREAYRDPKSEDATAWYWWSLAYFCLVLTVLLRFEEWIDIAYPLSFLALHFIVALLASDIRPRLQRKFLHILST